MRRTFVDLKKAQDYRDLCDESGNIFKTMPKVIKTKKQKIDYEVLEKYHDKTNCKAILFRKDDEYIVSFFGTDFSNVKDLGTNVAMVAGKYPKQFKKAEQFTRDMIKKYNIPHEKLTAIGNSEGGAEAIHVKGTLGIKEVYTYNGYVPRLNKYSVENLQDNNFYNFRTANDVVSKAGHVIGQDFIVPLEMENGGSPKNGPLGIGDWHRIKNMGDCRMAKFATEYENENPNWKNKYKLGILKSYEIGDIPDGLYPIFDEAINDRINNQAIVNAPRPNNSTFANAGSGCAGTYLVNGYTKADGTEVKPYYRTCGAKHNA